MNLKTIGSLVAASCLLSFNLSGQPTTPTSLPSETRSKDTRLNLSGSPLGIAWGFLYGYQGVKAERFMPQIRELGGGFTKIYLFWNQVEPQKGNYDWSAVDAFVNHLKTPESLSENSKRACVRSFGRGLRWLSPHSPLRGCSNFAPWPQPKSLAAGHFSILR